ncbi:MULTISPECIES: arsenate reductase ArsC [Pseudomonas]|uniref:Arsenate reductase ArsC n=1 Tax=Pseudomonas fluorescens TaxID=294 RepID=A0A944DNQ8_PSEFL|nr:MULTISPECIES: arsenate reductase ArsC [Pseudomonas]MBT2297614.1 arsenate reductase ArsC [Pseudomonas fluorescens]MBT2305812.1 arsenate reductase ArsC [Pseudomonas fluorescens]MBT2314165.1 arsenate reductase ArsC [Pseudomonas fluorescens]MBT2319343.1 arsenate reductase ArsC [Pseudomonas fluorescens]MBT2329240.1 arsenate reductase ArsC [Pseudomonas fluorescens]
MIGKASVLFVCTANAARSQLAQALLRHTDSEHFEAFSAGTAPTEVDPRTFEALAHLGVSTDGLRSKSIDEFRGERFDYVITLCDKAASECQSLPGAGEAMAWSFEDPVTSTKPDAFRHTLHEIHDRIKMFVLVKTKH